MKHMRYEEIKLWKNKCSTKEIEYFNNKIKRTFNEH